MNSRIINKICIRCKLLKPINNFGKYARSKDGLRSCCKDCKNKEDKDRYENNKKDVSTQTLLNIELDKMKNNIDNIEELKIYHDKVTKLITNLEIENKCTEFNSFRINKITNNLDEVKMNIVLRFLNHGMVIGSDTINIISKEDYYVIQIDNIHIEDTDMFADN